MKKIISIVLVLAMLFAFSFITSAKSEDTSLQFNEDGKFKIMQVNDTQDTHNINKKTVKFLKAALESEKPDLVVIAGDMLADFYPFSTKEKLEKALYELGKIFDDAATPFTMTFGNHDHDHKEILPLNEMVEVFKQFEYFRYSEGCDEGTFNLPILSSDASHYAINIYMMDTHGKVSGNYEGVYPEQVEWYKNKSDELKSENGGEAVPSIVFQHIPVKEIHQFYIEGEKGADDSFYNFDSKKWFTLGGNIIASESNYVSETPCSEPIDYTTGQYEAWLEKGDIIGAFFGHDHVNNFVGITEEGITLGYNGGSGFHSYGMGDKRSVRIFEFDENDVQNYTTRSILYSELTGKSFSYCIPDLMVFVTDIFRFFYKLLPFLK